MAGDRDAKSMGTQELVHSFKNPDDLTENSSAQLANRSGNHDLKNMEVSNDKVSTTHRELSDRFSGRLRSKAVRSAIRDMQRRCYFVDDVLKCDFSTCPLAVEQPSRYCIYHSRCLIRYMSNNKKARKRSRIIADMEAFSEPRNRSSYPHQSRVPKKS